MSNSNESVRVCVRCRPLNSKEKGDGRQTIVEIDERTGQVTLHNPKGDAGEPPKNFTFDYSFPHTITQKEVYDKCARPIVCAAMDGYNGTIFAYGQTGTGKTHTMDGGQGPEMQGIIPNTFEHIFGEVEASGTNKQWMVRASFLEIYNEEVRDLLSKDSKKSCEVKEHKESGVYVKGLNAFVVKTVPELANVLEYVVREAVQRWYEEARGDAERGDIKMCAMVGNMNEEGYGCDKDPKAGKIWRERGARYKQE
eukprot:gene12338-15515_t